MIRQAAVVLLTALLASAVRAQEPSAVPAHGAFLYSPNDRAVLSCGFAGCRTVAHDVAQVRPDELGGLYVFGSSGITHCADGSCVLLQAGLDLPVKFVRSAGRLYGTSPAAGTWLCRPDACRRLTPESFETYAWAGAFDADGFWGSGKGGTWRCDDAACRKISDAVLEFLFSVGVPGVKGVAWGGNKAGTWRCDETSCASKGGIVWYNTYAFDADGNLFGSSGFPDSSYACSANGCTKLDDRYRYWHGPDGNGRMLATQQYPAQVQRCDLTACEPDHTGIKPGNTVIGPAGSAAVAPAKAPASADGAAYAVTPKTEPRLARHASPPAQPGEILRSLGGIPSILTADAPVNCWTWEDDEDSPSAWENACSFY